VIKATARPLHPRERNTVPIVQEGGWDPRPVWTVAENVALVGIRPPDRPARSESLYRLRYADDKTKTCMTVRSSAYRNIPQFRISFKFTEKKNLILSLYKLSASFRKHHRKMSIHATFCSSLCTHTSMHHAQEPAIL
jgi:hypothetical protein